MKLYASPDCYYVRGENMKLYVVKETFDYRDDRKEILRVMKKDERKGNCFKTREAAKNAIKEIMQCLKKSRKE